MRRAFTLVEIVLAITLALGLVAAVLSFYRQCVDARRMVMDDLEKSTAQRAIMDRLTEDLRGAMAYPFLGRGLQGMEDSKTSLQEVRFVLSASPGPSAWVVRKSTEDPLPPQGDVQMIGYRLGTYVDDFNRLHVTGLERTYQKVLTARTVREGVTMQAARLTDRVKFLRLRYWNGAAWSNQWQQRDLPLAVEVVLGMQELPENVDPLEYPYPTSRRVIYLPGGSRALSGTVIRGLDGSQP